MVESEKTQEAEESEKFRLRDLKELTLAYWLVVVSIMFIYVASVNGISFGSGILQAKYGYSEDESGFFQSLPYLVTSVCSIPMGILSQKTGMTFGIVLMGIFILGLAHFLLIAMPPCADKCWNSVVPFVLLGIGYCTFTVNYWPIVGLMAKPSIVGSAYGILAVGYNFAIFVSSLIIGDLQDKTTRQGGYFWSEVLMIGMSAASFVTTLVVYFLAKKNKKR